MDRLSVSSFLSRSIVGLIMSLKFLSGLIYCGFRVFESIDYGFFKVSEWIVSGFQGF